MISHGNSTACKQTLDRYSNVITQDIIIAYILLLLVALKINSIKYAIDYMVELVWNYHMITIFVNNNRITRAKAQQNNKKQDMIS